MSHRLRASVRAVSVLAVPLLTLLGLSAGGFAVPAMATSCGQWTQVGAADPGSFSALRGLAMLPSGAVWSIDPATSSFEVSSGSGSAFQSVAAPSVSVFGSNQVGMLQGIGADTAGDVWAVGQHHAGTASYAPTSTLIERFDGRAWSIVPSPSPDPKSNVLTAVAALAPGNVWAVGQSGGHPLVEHFDGSAWSVVTTPVSTSSGRLNAIAAGASGVKAVGSYRNAAGSLTALVLSSNGSAAWSVDGTPAGASDPFALMSVTAVPGTRHFVAAGSSTADNLLVFDGSVWSSHPGAGSPFVVDGQAEAGYVDGVDAQSDTSIWVAGWYSGSQVSYYASQPFVVRSDGSSWSDTGFTNFSVDRDASTLYSIGHVGASVFVVGYDSPTPASWGDVFAARLSC